MYERTDAGAGRSTNAIHASGFQVLHGENTEKRGDAVAETGGRFLARVLGWWLTQFLMLVAFVAGVVLGVL